MNEEQKLELDRRVLVNQLEPIANTMALYKVLCDKGILTEDDKINLITIRDECIEVMIPGAETVAKLVDCDNLTEEVIQELEKTVDDALKATHIAPYYTDGVEYMRKMRKIWSDD